MYASPRGPRGEGEKEGGSLRAWLHTVGNLIRRLSDDCSSLREQITRKQKRQRQIQNKSSSFVWVKQTYHGPQFTDVCVNNSEGTKGPFGKGPLAPGRA